MKLFGFRHYFVVTGSMSGTLEVNDLIIVTKVQENKLKEGDVISFRARTYGGLSLVVTHFIASIEEVDGHRIYKTKSAISHNDDKWYDENKNPVDIIYSDIVGKVVLILPTHAIWNFYGVLLIFLICVVVFFGPIFYDILTPSFKNYIRNENTKEYAMRLKIFVDTVYTATLCHPDKKDIFKAISLTELKRLKVVIVGEEPYNVDGIADGLAFSSKSKEVPKTIVNMYKEIEDDLNITMNYKNGNLTPWAERGVLLLNRTLTVEDGRKKSHINQGWEIFTNGIIEKINALDRPIAFLLLGDYAKEVIPLINNPKHLIVVCQSPDPFVANYGFFGSKPFSTINAFLAENHKKPIDWSIK